jgi:large subunit ribosomal protein L37e
MVKGTHSQGLRQKRSHVTCRRCGSLSFSIHAHYCVACGFGRSKKQRKDYSWKERKP